MGCWKERISLGWRGWLQEGETEHGIRDNQNGITRRNNQVESPGVITRRNHQAGARQTRRPRKDAVRAGKARPRPSWVGKWKSLVILGYLVLESGDTWVGSLLEVSMDCGVPRILGVMPVKRAVSLPREYRAVGG